MTTKETFNPGILNPGSNCKNTCQAGMLEHAVKLTQGRLERLAVEQLETAVNQLHEPMIQEQLPAVVAGEKVPEEAAPEAESPESEPLYRIGEDEEALACQNAARTGGTFRRVKELQCQAFVREIRQLLGDMKADVSRVFHKTGEIPRRFAAHRRTLDELLEWVEYHGHCTARQADAVNRMREEFYSSFGDAKTDEDEDERDEVFDDDLDEDFDDDLDEDFDDESE